MIQANMHDAKTKLSQLVEAAERGESVFIARNGLPVAQLVAVPKQKFNFGFLKDHVQVPDFALFAMTDEEADQFIEGRW
jgi:prevent-host-death family protein